MEGHNSDVRSNIHEGHSRLEELLQSPNQSGLHDSPQGVKSSHPPLFAGLADDKSIQFRNEYVVSAK
jgi:hypothetical protein